MISERTLKRWRRDALKEHSAPECCMEKETEKIGLLHHHEMAERILRLTQELMDQYLLKKGK